MPARSAAIVSPIRATHVGSLPREPTDLSWSDLAADGVRDRHSEFLQQSGATRPDADLAETARDVAAGLAPHEAALGVAEHVHRAMTYLPGSTGVQTSAADAWETGANNNYTCADNNDDVSNKPPPGEGWSSPNPNEQQSTWTEEDNKESTACIETNDGNWNEQGNGSSWVRKSDKLNLKLLVDGEEASSRNF